MARPRLDRPRFRLVLRGDRYYIRWWQDGRWHRVSTGAADRGAAGKALAQFEAGFATPPPAPQATIGALLDAYIEDRRPRVAALDTLEVACKSLRRHLGDLLPQHLSRERCRLYARQRRAEGYLVGPPQARRRKPVADGTVIRELVTLRAALRNAGGEAASAANLVETPRNPPPRDRWLSRAEAARLLDSAKLPHVKLFVALALYTAGRSGALLALTWDAVDFAAGVISLGVGVGNKGRAVVPLAAALRPLLLESHAGATGKHVIEHGGDQVASIKTGFNAAARRAGLAGVTPHVLRHTAATWMAIGGIPMSEIARYLGNSEAMVEKVYAKHSPDYLRRAAEVLSGPVAPLKAVDK